MKPSNYPEHVFPIGGRGKENSKTPEIESEAELKSKFVVKASVNGEPVADSTLEFDHTNSKFSLNYNKNIYNIKASDINPI